MDSLNNGHFAALNKELFEGKNYILRFSKKGSSMFDPSWITKIEDCLFDLGEIVNNPREVTADEGSVTPIELAKKVNGESVQHLASHTQYIKDIDEAGNVMPAKILSHFNKQELHTYENRFIATFIRRLVLFIEKRYEFIKETINLENNEVLMLKNTSIINGQEVEIETKVTVKKEMQDDVTIAARDYIARIESMREYVSYYYNSPFMKEMKNEKDVKRPILQTNIIRKNPKYHKCFETFVFIERFEALGLSYKIDESYYDCTEEERAKLNYLLTGAYLALQDEDEYEVVKENSKTYKPKILTSIDDEKFIYGNLLEGPFEFVRVDEKYKNYLQGLVDTDLPVHPDKHEREYYSEEYKNKHLLLEKIKEIDQLNNRVERELAQWEKQVSKIIAERDIEEQKEAEKKIAELDKYQKSLLEKKRKLIVEAAKGQFKELKQEEKERQISEKALSSDVTGTFIVKTILGYYVGEFVFDEDKENAHVFDNIDEAIQTKNIYGGKVIKL